VFCHICGCFVFVSELCCANASQARLIVFCHICGCFVSASELCRLVGEVKILGHLSRSFRSIERKLVKKNNYTNGSEIARQIY
jgi:hypothetical protein